MMHETRIEARQTSPRVSIVVPVLNEEDAVAAFVAAVDGAAEKSWGGASGSAPDFEFVFIDDGSTDQTATRVKQMCENDNRVRLVRLSRNFGKEAALSAGLGVASGDAAIPMDVDLQDPPDLLKPMVDLWLGGAKVVNARRADRSQDPFFKRLTSKAFYKLMNRLSDHPIDEDVGDFRLLDRDALNVLNAMNESARFNKGLFSWIGFPSETIEYSRPARASGETKWSVTGLATLAIDGVVASTTLPLRIWTFVGGGIAALAFLYAIFLIVYTLYNGIDAPGYASLMVVVLFLGGLNLLSLGMIGEYLGRVSNQVRGRPLYIISEKAGF